MAIHSLMASLQMQVKVHYRFWPAVFCFAVSQLAYGHGREHEVASLDYGEAIFYGLAGQETQGLLVLESAYARGRLQPLHEHLFPHMFRGQLLHRHGLFEETVQLYGSLADKIDGDLRDQLNYEWGIALYQQGSSDALQRLELVSARYDMPPYGRYVLAEIRGTADSLAVPWDWYHRYQQLTVQNASAAEWQHFIDSMSQKPDVVDPYLYERVLKTFMVMVPEATHFLDQLSLTPIYFPEIKTKSLSSSQLLFPESGAWPNLKLEALQAMRHDQYEDALLALGNALTAVDQANEVVKQIPLSVQLQRMKDQQVLRDWVYWRAQPKNHALFEEWQVLENLSASMKEWQQQVPFLKFTLEQQRAFFQEKLNSAGLESFYEQQKQLKNELSLLQHRLAKAKPYDHHGLLYPADVKQYLTLIEINQKRLVQLHDASLLNDAQLEEHQSVLAKAKGRLLWEMSLKWSEHFRAASKSVAIMQSQLQENDVMLSELARQQEQWKGQQYQIRLETLEGQIGQVRQNIELAQQKITAGLLASLDRFNTELVAQRAVLAQALVRRKIELIEGVVEAYVGIDIDQPEALAARQVLVESYQRYLSGPLSESARHEARLAMAGHLLTLGEHNDDALRQSLAEYTLWLEDATAEHANHDKVLYRLAKIHSLLGQQAKAVDVMIELQAIHPDHDRFHEIAFRLGEDAFVRQAYEDAIEYYGLAASNPEFDTMAHYMQGWSYFKAGNLKKCIETFVKVIRDSEIENPRVESLVDDAKRISRLAMFQNGGGFGLSQLYPPPLTDEGVTGFTLYQQHLKDKALYLDLVELTDLIEQRYPRHEIAPTFALDTIETLRQHSFFSAMREQQQKFIETYKESERVQVRESILSFGASLGDYYRAQFQSNNNPELLERAVGYYRAGVSAGNALDQPHAVPPELTRRLADSLYDLGRLNPTSESAVLFLVESASLYETLSKTPVLSDDDRAKAALAVLAVTGFLAELDLAQPLPASMTVQQARLNFIEQFPWHEQAPVIRMSGAHEAFDQQDYASAWTLVMPLVMMLEENPSQLMAEVQAYDVIDVAGNTLFNLKEYARAQQVFEFGLDRLPQPVPGDYQRSFEAGLGDSLFEQGKQLQDREPVLARAAYHRLVARLPNHTLAAPALYELASFTMEPTEILVYLNTLVSDYPESDLQESSLIKLIQISQEQALYIQAINWIELYKKRWAKSDQERMELTFDQARLLVKSDARIKAVSLYRAILEKNSGDYWLKAAQALDDLYESSGVAEDIAARLVLQQDIVDRWGDRVDQMGPYEALLLKSAQSLAMVSLNEFQQQPLKQPLNQSLPKKQASLKQAVTAHQRLIDYAVSPYYEYGVYGLGQVYLQFARDLMASDRPEGLSDLALEEYEMLLEEQAYPFEEKGIEYHELNLKRLWQGEKNTYTLESLMVLQKVLSSQYNREEMYARIYLQP